MRKQINQLREQAYILEEMGEMEERTKAGTENFEIINNDINKRRQERKLKTTLKKYGLLQ